MPSDPRLFRPSRPEDWEPYKAQIAELYRTKKLKEVMEEMETVWWFKATTRQYKTKIKEWDLDTKYTKTQEYLAILKVKRKREREDPSRGSQFYLRGKRIEDSAIARFEARAIKRGIITAEETLSDKDDVSDLECYDGEETYVDYDETALPEASYTEGSFAEGSYTAETSYAAESYTDIAEGSGSYQH